MEKSAPEARANPAPTTSGARKIMRRQLAIGAGLALALGLGSAAWADDEHRNEDR